ncbi:AI-2E family transporter [Aliiglaciecola sp. CAU 1673]|uniref:AI-2E family transporter n=1 Tax=Aliiglaciecola sp. CAU 1673 TaxID=3032595 RepID=UPI0023DA0026|nr:AI-2E family transporter [Aliiglaciecola sp. CAU 1673]MDF2178822.1 AI-2E family transporter [Aliiglaciecola sp. CAU 1673]
MEIKSSSSAKVLLIMASLVVILAGVKAASSVVVPFLLSIFIAMACNPLVNWAGRYKVPRWLAVMLVILLIVIFGFMLAGLVGQSMNEFSRDLPKYKQQLTEEFSWLAGQLANLNIHIDRKQLVSYLDPGLAMNLASNLLSSLGGVMTNFLLILLTVVFMLFEADSVPRKVHIALDDPAMKIKQIDKFLSSVKNYLVIKTVVSLATGILAGVLLYFIGVKHFLLWATLAFLLNYVPNIGSIIAAVPPTLLALVQLGPGSAGLVALSYILINTVMGNMVEPRYMGKGLGLSTLVVFLSLIFWGWLLGSIGMLLSVPLTMIVKIALETTEGGRWFALLLSDEQSLSALTASKADATESKNAQ